MNQLNEIEHEMQINKSVEKERERKLNRKNNKEKYEKINLIVEDLFKDPNNIDYEKIEKLFINPKCSLIYLFELQEEYIKTYIIYCNSVTYFDSIFISLQNKIEYLYQCINNIENCVSNNKDDFEMLNLLTNENIRKTLINSIDSIINFYTLMCKNHVLNENRNVKTEQNTNQIFNNKIFYKAYVLIIISAYYIGKYIKSKILIETPLFELLQQFL